MRSSPTARIPMPRAPSGTNNNRRGSKADYTRSRVDAAGSHEGTLDFRCGASMDRCAGAAALLPESDRKDLAVQALARSATISDLADRHGVSRKFVYRQTDDPNSSPMIRSPSPTSRISAGCGAASSPASILTTRRMWLAGTTRSPLVRRSSAPSNV